MVVEKNHRGGRRPQRRDKNLSRMHNAQCEATFRDHHIANNVILGIQQDHPEDLVPQVTQARVVVLEKVRTRVDAHAGRQWGRHGTLADLHSGLELGSFGWPYPRDCTEFLSTAVQKTDDSSNALKHVHRNVHRRGVLPPDAQQNREQLGIG
jgi:hypothetical protein